MPINVLGMIGVAAPGAGSTVHIVGGGVDPAYVADFAGVHEASGFDAALVGYSSASADGFSIAQYAAAHTRTLQFLVAHRPGFVAPTLAARKVATLDQLTGGRIWLHIISGGVDADQRRDGDFVGHDARYARTAEYMEILRRTWTADSPFDYHGAFYRLDRAYSEVRCKQTPHVPLWFGGVSEAAKPVGASWADTYALFGEPRAQIRALIRELRAFPRAGLEPLRFNVSFRPIIGASEAQAWARAEQILADVKAGARAPRRRVPEAETARRLVRLIEGGEIHDERLWVPIAAAAHGSGNSTALVGTAYQVADAIGAYYQLGVSGVLIRGFDPYGDAEEYGKELIPAIRERVAHIDRSRGARGAWGDGGAAEMPRHY